MRRYKPSLSHALICAIVMGLIPIIPTAAAGLAWTGLVDAPGATAQIHGKVFKLDIAASPRAREIGLSQTDSLPEDRGMLFLFDKPDYYPFWMKGMKFPLDILFIRDSTIVSIKRNLQPPTSEGNPPSYAPEQPADRVLEINAGLCDKYNINVGDVVRITFGPGYSLAEPAASAQKIQ